LKKLKRINESLFNQKLEVELLFIIIQGGFKMNAKNLLIGAALSGIVAGFSGCATDQSASSSKALGQCHGINSCKGKGVCGSKTHSCAGQNSCKGKGWLKMTEDDCEGKGGEFKA
jgi:hypothetical protein